ncbi:hypothetical protein TraAM80_05607 [Trypanosoma rangeli]|uniref:Uncharacterized protein n=1 Tax=Trypanosoma rangeli TaxID=5698 RepID=A0A3R7KL07_TRYRA|nr:uncharacterized protein TraAM80_05607 [Trypanosoma rangeli]RNF03549.1 hypothetical protein TraAM80_05607 [Trypanosoma rangeli]|eukprot:RNF03549.1 hypothetical protein TraAM80_05607 [Trypanosoma rangeli]
MTAREAVLTTKAMLAAVPGASLLSREAFITICVKASLAFLQKRGWQRSSNKGGKRDGDGDGRRKPRALLSPHTDVTQSKGNNFTHHHSYHQPPQHCRSNSGGGNKNNAAQLRPRHGTSGRWSVDEQEKEPPQHRWRSPFSEGELRRLRELVEREYAALHRDIAAVPGDVVTTQFTALPPAKQEAVTIIRQALQDPYRRGAISRHHYSAIVLAVMETLFPDLVSVTSDSTLPGSRSPSRSSSRNGGGGASSNNVRGNVVKGAMVEGVEEEEVFVDPPQDPHAALRPDVVELTMHLTERALQHYILSNHNAHQSRVVEEDVAETGEVCRGRWVTNDVSPLPRDPYDPVTSQAVGQDGTPTPVVFSPQFDDAFEEQVEKLRQLLEKKYALGLSDTCAGSSRRSGCASGDDAAKRTTNVKSNAATDGSAAANARGQTLCGGGRTAEVPVAAREKREELLAEALRCQKELYRTHARLSEIMQDLCETEHFSSDPTGCV